MYRYLPLLAASLSLCADYHVKSTKNIGYPQNKLPVPITACLSAHAVKGENTTIHFGSAVEPTIAVNPYNTKHLVACWLQDQFSHGDGALELAIAYSHDMGESFKRSEIPLQICMGGTKQRITHATLGWSADGKRIYLSGHAINVNAVANAQNQQTVFVSISDDGGKTWSNPDSVSPSVTTLGGLPMFALDANNSFTAHPTDRKLAYTVWSHFKKASSFHADTHISRTHDAGYTWSSHHLLYNPFPDLCSQGLSNCIESLCQTQHNTLLVLPEATENDSLWKKDHWGDAYNKADRFSGDLLNIMQRIYAIPTATAMDLTDGKVQFSHTIFDIACVRSQDKGATWDPNALVIIPGTKFAPVVYTGGYSYDKEGNITGGIGTRVHASPPSFAMNPLNGFLYVVYQTNEFRQDRLPQIGLSTSRDGGYSWSAPIQINPKHQYVLNAQAFAPSIAINKSGYVGILYTDFRFDNTHDLQKTKADKWLAIYKEVKKSGSTGIGLDFVTELRLTDESYIVQHAPTKGDAVHSDASHLATQDDIFFAVYTKSHPGPFFEPSLLLDDDRTSTMVMVDDNYRQSPYISIVKP